MNKSLLVVGWDAATAPHLEDFDLPFFDNLDHNHTLKPEPFWQDREVDSGSAWTTITTGLSMWEHRVATLTGMIESPWKLRTVSTFDRFVPRELFNTPARIWFRRLALGKQPTNDDIPYKRVWHYVSDSLAAFVPLTYPPKPTDGVTISGFPSQEIAVQPREFEETIRELYSGEPQRRFDDDGGIREEYIDDLFSCHDQRVETIRFLTDEREFNLVFVVFTLLDRLLHVTDPGNDRIQNAYEQIDRSTETLVDHINPDEVLILSDHGMKFAPRWKWRHIHDENTGIWAGSRNFSLSTHLDVTPEILSYFDLEIGDSEYQKPTSEQDTQQMREQLKDLGYI